MILKKREKILALVTVLLLMVVVLHQAYSKLRGSQGGLEKQHAAAAAKLARMKTRLQNAKSASDRLDKWRSRSLPSDTHAARSLYQNWLFQLAHDAKFSETKISVLGKPRRGSNVYCPLKFDFKSEKNGF